jgi:hypothetical protein
MDWAMGQKTKSPLFFEEFQQLRQSFPPEFVFGADETIIIMTKAHKAVTGERMAMSVEAFENQVPHISVMLTHSVARATVPLFVILPHLQQPTADFIVIMKSFKAWVGSTAKEWQIRQSFFSGKQTRQ